MFNFILPTSSNAVIHEMNRLETLFKSEYDEKFLSAIVHRMFILRYQIEEHYGDAWNLIYEPILDKYIKWCEGD